MSYLNLRPTDALAADGYMKRDRVRAALNGEPVDRPPLAFWHHPPHTNSGADLANFSIDLFARKFDTDIVKIMSDVRYPLPALSMRTPQDWRRVEDWAGQLTDFTRSYVSAVRQARALLGPAYPLIVTVYSAVVWANGFTSEPDRLLHDFKAEPALLHNAMANLASNTRHHIDACIEAGADGIFLSISKCDKSIPAPIYREFCKPYDLMVLQGAKNGWLNILHVHGDDPSLRLDETLEYPVHAFSWATHTTGHGLAEMRAKTGRCLMAGWDHTSPLLTDTAADDQTLLETWTEQARSAVAELDGKGLILAPGCSVPNEATHSALAAMRRAVDQL
uniref:Uroporphyrinogen decarboxylase (URO-D) domain-containing protein n=1 Tax=Bosea sp. NBC_00436 TaxID=2969620 RepID=A0A9E7ZJ91_9HYPH